MHNTKLWFSVYHQNYQKIGKNVLYFYSGIRLFHIKSNKLQNSY